MTKLYLFHFSDGKEIELEGEIPLSEINFEKHLLFNTGTEKILIDIERVLFIKESEIIEKELKTTKKELDKIKHEKNND